MTCPRIARKNTALHALWALRMEEEEGEKAGEAVAPWVATVLDPWFEPDGEEARICNARDLCDRAAGRARSSNKYWLSDQGQAEMAQRLRANVGPALAPAPFPAPSPAVAPAPGPDPSPAVAPAPAPATQVPRRLHGKVALAPEAVGESTMQRGCKRPRVAPAPEVG